MAPIARRRAAWILVAASLAGGSVAFAVAHADSGGGDSFICLPGLLPPPGVLGGPDLVVSDLRLEPAAPRIGDSVVFTATVHNQGDNATGNFSVGFRLDRNLSLGDPRVEELAANASVDVQSDAWVATEGNHTIRAIADVFDDVLESNELNNERSKSFVVEDDGGGGGPFGVDLSPDNQSRTVLPGGNATYHILVKNIGDVADRITLHRSAPPAGWNVTWSIHNVTIPGDTTVVDLDAGASLNLRLDVHAPLLPLSGLSATVAVTGTSGGDPAESDRATTETRILLP